MRYGVQPSMVPLVALIRPRRGLVGRLLDVTITSAVPVMPPPICAARALASWRGSPVPLSSRQERVGLCDKTFTWRSGGRGGVTLVAMVELAPACLREQSFRFEAELLPRTVPAALSTGGTRWPD